MPIVTRKCEKCGNSFDSWEQYHKRYCSDACKQAAYRDFKRSPKGAPANAVETKRNQGKSKYCAHCGKSFLVNGLQHARRYCSDACKQAAYRERAQMEKEWKERQNNWNSSAKTNVDRSELALETMLEGLLDKDEGLSE